MELLRQFWTDPLVQLNPSYKQGATIHELIQRGYFILAANDTSLTIASATTRSKPSLQFNGRNPMS